MAKAGERVTLLDDKEYALDPDNLVIADGSGPIGLAGIMGGRAPRFPMRRPMYCWKPRIFHPMSSRAGRARMGLFTDAAQRFERGVDPSLPALAIDRRHGDCNSNRRRRRSDRKRRQTRVDATFEALRGVREQTHSARPARDDIG